VNLNTANRSFFTLAGIVLVPYALLGLFGCGLLATVVYRLAHYGFAGLDRNGEDLRPALLFFAVVTAGSVIGGLSVRRQIRATRRLAVWVADRALSPTPDIARAITRAGVNRVDVVDERHPCSFTYGLFAPRVAITSGLAELVDEDELTAVLHHERYHVHAYDTLKVVIARAGVSAFFFLPVLGHLRDRYLATRELAADRQAVRALGERSLAGALYRVTDGPSFAEFGAAAALGGSEFLEQRVDQLEHGEEPAMPALPRRAVWLTAAGLLVLSGVFVLTLASGGGDDTMTMGSMRMGGGFGTLAAVLGASACTAGWLVIGALVLRRAGGHRLMG
jgi:Zn-dependent protease with chaperone function